MSDLHFIFAKEYIACACCALIMLCQSGLAVLEVDKSRACQALESGDEIFS